MHTTISNEAPSADARMHMLNSDLMQNMWLSGCLGTPKDMRQEPLDVVFEVPDRAVRMHRSELTRLKRARNKGIILKKTERLGKKFCELSNTGHSAQAKRVLRERDCYPHVRVRAN